jgi:hypothetical protein
MNTIKGVLAIRYENDYSSGYSYPNGFVFDIDIAGFHFSAETSVQFIGLEITEEEWQYGIKWANSMKQAFESAGILLEFCRKDNKDLIEKKAKLEKELEDINKKLRKK